MQNVNLLWGIMLGKGIFSVQWNHTAGCEQGEGWVRGDFW